MRLIILAAGQGFQLDGFNKILLKDPISRKAILDQYLQYFPEYPITVVVGFKAITIMSEYPQLHYVYNPEWRTKGNSYSLALALSEEPCTILPSDLFFDQELAERIRQAPPNSGLVAHTENRSLQALHCQVVDGTIADVYKGDTRPGDPELMGVFKISDKEILRRWRLNCLANDTVSAFIGENLPFRRSPIHVIEKGRSALFEINTPFDYLSFINAKGAPR